MATEFVYYDESDVSINAGRAVMTNDTTTTGSTLVIKDVAAASSTELVSVTAAGNGGRAELGILSEAIDTGKAAMKIEVRSYANELDASVFADDETRPALAIVARLQNPTDDSLAALTSADLFIIRNETSDVLKVTAVGSLKCLSTTGTLNPPNLTNAQRDAILADDGAIIYNNDVGKLESRESGTWTHFVNDAATSTGDLLYYTGSTYTKLPIGSEESTLKISSALPSWSALTFIEGELFVPSSGATGLSIASGVATNVMNNGIVGMSIEKQSGINLTPISPLFALHFQFLTTGYYYLVANCSFRPASPTPSGAVEMYVQIHGSSGSNRECYTSQCWLANPFPTGMTCTGVIRVDNLANYYDLIVFQNSGTSQILGMCDTTNNPQASRYMVRKICEL